MPKKSKQEGDPAEKRHKEQMKELQDIRKLLVLLLLSSDVQKGEIEEILGIGDRNFAKFYSTDKLIDRMRQEAEKK